MNAKIFNAISDSEFRIKAFSDYCDDTQQAYQKLLQAETMALEQIPDDPDDDNPIDFDSAAESILESLNISPTNMLLFNEGYISSKDYIISLMRGFHETIVNEQGTLQDSMVRLKDASGKTVSIVNLDQLTLEVKENLYSITALCAANAAATIDNVADRISVYNDKLTSIFQNAYSTVSSTATYLRTMISDANFKSSDYLEKVDALTGISRLAEDDSSALPNDMDITKFTGANPACPLNFNGVFSAVGTAFNVGLKVVGGILKVGASLVGKVFSKVKNFFHKTIVDPYDLEEINSSAGSYTVDGWRYNVGPYDESTRKGNDFFDFNDTFNSYLNNLPASVIDSYINKWVKYETIFGEVMFKLDHWTKGGSLYEFFPYTQFKPKALNPDAVYLSAKTVWGENATDPQRRFINSTDDKKPTLEELLTFIDNLKNQPDLYLSTDANEKKLCLSFVCAQCLNDYFSQCAFYEMVNSISDSDTDYKYPAFTMLNVDDWIAIDLTRKVTNIDFVESCSGWSQAHQEFGQFTVGPNNGGVQWSSTPFPFGSVPDFAKNYFLAWILNRADREVNPINYTFVPYRNNVDSWNESRFRIKTDAENQQAFNTLLTVAIVTVLVATLAISSTILIKKAVRSLYMKRTAALGKMDNAMWNGQTLTKKEQKKYIRLQRKLNGSTALSSGLQDSTNLFSSVSDAVSTVSEDISGVSQIASLIRP